MNRKPSVESSTEVGEKAQFETVSVDITGMRRLNVRPQLSTYVANLWERRHFIVTDARLRAFRTAKSYRLWRFWLIAQPLLDAAMYGFIFGFLLRTSRGVDNFLGYLVLGVTFFGLLTGWVNGGTSLLQTSKNLMQAFAFPRAAIVFSQSLRYMIDNLPSLIVGVVFALVAQWQKPIAWTIVLVVPLTGLMWIFGTGLMFIVARITGFIPDAKVLINLAVRAWFFSSGVFFSLDRFAHTPALYNLFQFNPGYLFLDAVRDSVIYATPPAPQTWAYLILWSLSTFVLGFVFFWRAEARYVNVRH